MKKKAVLIQNYLSPYRIPLFSVIATSDSIDLTVALMAPDKPDYPEWTYDFDSLPFRTAFIPGKRIVLSSRYQVCINPGLVKFLRREKPDIIFCSGFTVSTFFACLFRIFTGKPLVIWSEGTRVTESGRRFAMARKMIRKVFSKLASGFVAAGQESQDYILSLLPKKSAKPIGISYNCVDSEALFSACRRFKEDASTWPRFRGAFPEKNILFSGRLEKIKGIHSMLDVYKKVLEKSPQEIGLILLGEGRLREYIQEEKAKYGLEHLHMKGFIAQDEYPKYFAAADLFLLLSLSDCNPLVIFEALSCGLPVVCSDRVGNAADFVAEGRNGYVVGPFDIEGAASKVLSVLFHSKIDEMRQFSLEIVKKANYRNSAEAFTRIAAGIPGKNS
jgi:glycosyltransferase involved in cell wall biosynthesis